MTISTLIVLIALPHGTIQTRRASIPLVSRADVIAFEPASLPALELVVRAAPGASTLVLPREGRAILGASDPAALKKRLQSAGAVKRFFAVYSRERRDDVLISDGYVQVRFDARTSETRARALIKLAGLGGARLERPAMNLWSARADDPASALSRVAALRGLRGVVWANVDFLARVDRRAVPNDPLFGEQWHHKLIGSAAAWDITEGSAAIKVAVIDTGIDVGHPELAGKIVDPRDTTADDDDPSPEGFGEEHGTACSGIVAAASDNALGVAGVCPDCSLMPIRALLADFGAMSDSAQAFYWAADHGAHVISNSWGMPVDQGLEDAIEHAATQARSGKGSLVLFASGNDGVVIASDDPAALPTTMAIGATSYWDELTEYSSYGAVQALTAPDSAVTTDVRGGDGYDPSDYTDQFGGTSAACPTVAGVAGLVFSELPVDATAGAVKDILTATADKIGAHAYVSGRNDYYGYGRVNALRAVQMASDSTVCQPMAELCSSGVDEDCDGLADMDDLGCAPEVPLVVGAECESIADCGREGRCMGDFEGFPGGYCSKTCDGGGCPAGSACSEGICLKSCTGDGDCRTGYVCDAGACVPPINLGVACASGTECGAAFCLGEEYGFPGGLCTLDCDGFGDECPGGAVCGPNYLCLMRCADKSDCRAGYTCDAFSDISMCVPESNGAAPPGAACSQQGECSDNGTCLQEFFGNPLPGGYCSVMCTSDDECPSGSSCDAYFGSCFPRCGSASDCREGYECYEVLPGSTPTCWTKCTSNADCFFEACNEHGLCGDREPFVNPNPCSCDLSNACDGACACDPDCGSACACDLTSGACDTGCACDAVCGEPEPAPRRKKKGCAAGEDPSLVGLLALVFLLTRGRRVP